MFGLNAVAAAAGLAGTVYITWFFGLSEFAYYTINFAKFSLLLLATELLPSSFSVFRIQDDVRFSAALPVFYLVFASGAAVASAALILTGVVNHASWFMVPFVFTAALQRYFDVQAQASGRVDAFFWIPAASNIARLVLLAGLSQSRLFLVPDVLWAATAIGSAIGQAVMLTRFPEFFKSKAFGHPVKKIHYLWSIRRSYFGYYANSVLKRLRDTFLPLFCDFAIPSKSEIGRLLVYTRANEAVCSQVRVLEAFMVNRAIRENLRQYRRRIFWSIGPVGQLFVAVIALGLIYRSGIGRMDIVLAFGASFFIYPYILELFWRNDALASFTPRQVTISLLAFLSGLVFLPSIAWAFGVLSIPILIFSYVLGQSLSAATYALFPERRATSGDLERCR